MLSAGFVLFLFLTKFLQIDGIINRPSYTPEVPNKRPLWIRNNISNRDGYSERTIPLVEESKYRPQKLKFSLKKPKMYNDIEIGSIFDQKPITVRVTNKNGEIPFFETMSGDTDIPPIFIYNMPRGEMIVNTLLNDKKYPMEEPVPGQVLYPPTVPLFKPIPIGNQKRISNGNIDTESLQLIPFYEHEALDYGTSITTTAAPQFYEPARFSYATSRLSTDLRKGRKERPFLSYKSPDEVNWQPYVKYSAICTTPLSAVLPSPLKNHRLQTDFASTESISNSNEKAERFKIIYEEDDNGKDKDLLQSTKPKLSSRYSVAKKYLAFPVFSLGKLLNTQQNEFQSKVEHEKKNAMEQHKQTNDTNTWFILNSRYKGHQSKPKLNEAYLVDTHNSIQQYFPENAQSIV